MWAQNIIHNNDMSSWFFFLIHVLNLIDKSCICKIIAQIYSCQIQPVFTLATKLKNETKKYIWLALKSLFGLKHGKYFLNWGKKNFIFWTSFQIYVSTAINIGLELLFLLKDFFEAIAPFYTP